MLKDTRTMIELTMNRDPSITDDVKILALKILSGAGKEVYGGCVAPMVVSRREAGIIAGMSEKRVDYFTRKGVFKRVRMPGQNKASGILRSSVESVIMAGAR